MTMRLKKLLVRNIMNSSKACNKVKHPSRNIIFIAIIIVSLTISTLLYSGKMLIVETPVPMNADVIVVLGCPSTEDGRPTPTMISRVDTGIQLLNKRYAPRIIFTGGAVANQNIEAKVMANYANGQGISMDIMILEENAKDTIQNAEFVARIMRNNKWDSAIIVTSPYHTRRALKLFSDEGIITSIVASQRVTEISWLSRVDSIFHEYIAFTWYALSGR